MGVENQFPFEIVDVEPELNKKLLKYFTGKLICM